MLLTLNIDVSEGLALCDALLKKIPYATNNALTRTAKELVEVEREELRKEFKVRKRFILDKVKILIYSRPDSLWTYVGVDTRNIAGGEMLLTKYEEGGEKTPELGSELAIPITGSATRPAPEDPVRPGLLYKKLNLLRHITRNGVVQFKGDHRSFVMPGIGVFQRTSSRQRKTRAKKGVAASKGADENIVLLYRFAPRVPLHQQMHFEATARDFVTKRFPAIWREEFIKELAGRAK